jgi:malate dehydrogenase (oxaloacetate-decarboxylating)
MAWDLSLGVGLNGARGPGLIGSFLEGTDLLLYSFRHFSLLISMDESEPALKAHALRKGKIEVVGSVAMDNREDLSVYYTPGVAKVALAIKADKALAYDYTIKGRAAAIISDGTRVLGLGDIGPEAAMPIMEGKALLLKKLAGVDAMPICLNTKSEEKIIEMAKALEPNFAVINIEDIETPKCLNIVERLSAEMQIPIFHDDRTGTAIVTLAALLNSLKLAGKKLESARIAINGSGAAGMGIAELLVDAGAKHVYLCDTTGIVYRGRKENMNRWKERIAEMTNNESRTGTINDAVRGADVLIGVSIKGAFSPEMIKSMAEKPIVFALTNPYPEIDYQEAKNAGAFIAATGRSDRPNQVNNLLAFPGIIAGLIESRAKRTDKLMYLRAAQAIARYSSRGMGTECVIANPIDRRTVRKLAPRIAAVVAEAAIELGLARTTKTPKEIEKAVAASIRRYSRIERATSK